MSNLSDDIDRYFGISNPMGANEDNISDTLEYVPYEVTQRDRFNDVITRRLRKTQETFDLKNLEYGQPNDVYHNFNTAGAINRQTPEEALWGMASKHLVSIIDMIKNPSKVTRERVDEKMGDMVTYLILLEGLLLERDL